MSFLSIFKTNCKQATFLHEKRKDGAISMTERLSLNIHLLYCSLCKLFLRQAEQLEKASKTLSNQDVQLSPNTKENIKKALDEQIKG